MRKSQTVRRAAVAGAAAGAVALACARRGAHMAAAGVVAGAGAGLWAAFAPRNPLMGRVLWRGPGTAPRASLTFDDGPGPSTSALLDALRDAGVRATFFVLGRQVERHPDVVRRMHAEGHLIANHGYDHGILVFRGPRHVADQIRRTQRAVQEAVGRDVTARLFRAPHGFRGPGVGLGARAAGYRMVAWSRGVFDTAEPGVEVIVARCRQALTPGAVVLLHDADGWDPGRSRPQTVAAVPEVCAAATAGGLRLVRLDELVAA